MPGTCVFTIVSRNYLGFAETLMQSVAKYGPTADRKVILCEREVADTSLDFEIVPINDLNISPLERMALRYTQVELLTSIKPWCFQHLFQQGYDKVIYFDPDIRLYSYLGNIESKLDTREILLTPHQLSGPDVEIDGLHREVLDSGMYNLGFLGLRQSPNTKRMISEWREYLEWNCVVDRDKKRFVDQKWMDIVPDRFESVLEVLDSGWNVAYWNIAEREIAKKGDGFIVNGEPLVFFHFSGIRPSEKVFSAHPIAPGFEELNTATREIVEEYMGRTRGKVDHYDRNIRFSFSEHDGIMIPDIAKTAYRELRESSASDTAANPADPGAIIEYLNQPVELGGITYDHLSRLSHYIYANDSNLQAQFPDILQTDAVAYTRYFSTRLKRQYRLTDALTKVTDDESGGIVSRLKSWLWLSCSRVYDNSKTVRYLFLKTCSPAQRDRVFRALLR